MRRPAFRLVLALTLAILAAPALATPPTYLRTIGGPGAGPGQFSLPIGVAVAPDGDLFVLDQELPRVTRFHPDGTYVLDWDPSAGLPFPYAQPMGIEVAADGTVLVSMRGGGYPARIRLSTGNGATITDVLGDGIGNVLGEPWGMFTQANGAVVIADLQGRIWRWNGVLTLLASGSGCGPGEFWSPTGIASVGSNLYVTEYSDRLQKLGANGSFVAELGSSGSCGSIRGYPRSVTADALGRLIVVDALTDQAQILTTSGAVIENFGGSGTGPGQFRGPFDVAASADGTIYVADAWNSRVQAFVPALPTAATPSSWGRLKALYR